MTAETKEEKLWRDTQATLKLLINSFFEFYSFYHMFEYESKILHNFDAKGYTKNRFLMPVYYIFCPNEKLST